MRHGFVTDYDPQPGASISTLAYEYPPGFDVPLHAHGSDQLIYATNGVMEVSAGQSFWLIPPQFAVWIPTRTMHSIHMPGAVSMRTLYLRPGLARGLPPACTVLHVTALLRELIVEAVRLGQLLTRNRMHGALKDLLLFHLTSAPAVATFLTMPRDTRALAVARALMANQSASPSFESLCEDAGASVRTIQRAFRREVGVDFETWRRQARLIKAVGLLVGGHSVKQVAFDVGYRQTGAFVEMFRRTFGTTPKAWASALQESKSAKR